MFLKLRLILFWFLFIFKLLSQLYEINRYGKKVLKSLKKKLSLIGTDAV